MFQGRREELILQHQLSPSHSNALSYSNQFTPLHPSLPLHSIVSCPYTNRLHSIPTPLFYYIPQHSDGHRQRENPKPIGLSRFGKRCLKGSMYEQDHLTDLPKMYSGGKLELFQNKGVWETRCQNRGGSLGSQTAKPLLYGHQNILEELNSWAVFHGRQLITGCQNM